MPIPTQFARPQHLMPRRPCYNPQFGFPSKLRILPSVIPAHSAFGTIRPPAEGLLGDQGIGCGRGRATSRAACPITATRFASPPRSPTSSPRNPPWQPPWSHLGVRPVRCLDAAIVLGSPVGSPVCGRSSATGISTLSTSIRLSWPIGARLALRSLPRRSRPRIVVTEHNVWSSHAPLTRLADRLTAGRNETHFAVSRGSPRLAPRPDPEPDPGDPLRRRHRRAPRRTRAPGGAAPTPRASPTTRS